MAATAIASTIINSINGTADPAEVAIDPANGSVVTNTGQTLILVDNTDSVAHNVTFKTVELEQGGLTVTNKVVNLAAGAKVWYKGFSLDVFGAQLTIAVDSGLTAAAAPTVSNAASGGTVLAGVYQAEVTYVNQYGETVASAPASTTTTGTTSTLTVTSPPAVVGATGWYAYVTQAAGSTFTRQQTAGQPTAIGTNLVLTAPPTSGGAAAPVGTALVKLKVIEN